jgi:hypothetical protein
MTGIIPADPLTDDELRPLRWNWAALGLTLVLSTAVSAGAHERDTVEAAIAARVSLKDMEELVACLEDARSYHPELFKKTRADLVRMARGMEEARTLSGETGPEGQQGALATCHLLRDLP